MMNTFVLIQMGIQRDYRSILRAQKQHIRNPMDAEWAVALKNRNVRLGKKAYLRDDFKGSMKYFKAAADSGLVFAQYLLAAIYCENDPPMYKEAFKYWKLAADVGYSEAQKHLAYMHLEGVGTPMDDKKGVTMLQLCADGGNAEAQFDVGKIYFNGRIVDRDIDQALMYFNRSAEQGYLPAMYYIGKCKLLGLGIVADCKEAFKLFKLAACSDYSFENSDRDIEEAVLKLTMKTRNNDCDKRQRIRWLNDEVVEL